MSFLLKNVCDIQIDENLCEESERFGQTDPFVECDMFEFEYIRELASNDEDESAKTPTGRTMIPIRSRGLPCEPRVLR